VHPDNPVGGLYPLLQVFHNALATFSPLLRFFVERRGDSSGQAKQAQKNVVKKYLQKEKLSGGKGSFIRLIAVPFY
jgi:hypothetical protein